MCFSIAVLGAFIHSRYYKKLLYWGSFNLWNTQEELDGVRAPSHGFSRTAPELILWCPSWLGPSWHSRPGCRIKACCSWIPPSQASAFQCWRWALPSLGARKTLLVYLPRATQQAGDGAALAGVRPRAHGAAAVVRPHASTSRDILG